LFLRCPGQNGGVDNTFNRFADFRWGFCDPPFFALRLHLKGPPPLLIKTQYVEQIAL